MCEANYNISEIIGKIRDEVGISDDEVRAIVAGITDGTVSDAQVGAFAMAVLCRGLDDRAAITLVKAMRDSGQTLRWDVDGPVVDKHSTGGVGDCVSLALAPILACGGFFVPMISGRGLGHTGGTLDKLESIPGFSTNIGITEMQEQLKSIGCVMAGQSSDLAPADKRLYSIRDITGTVPSPELITASILSKKLAAGLDRLVLDVKFGSGAFMKNIDEASALARRLVDTSNILGVKTAALITAMEEPLACAAGNALEVVEVLDLLEGNVDSDLYAVTQRLCSGLGMNEEQVREAVLSGDAMENFERMCSAQGGPSSASEIRSSLPKAAVKLDIFAEVDGVFNGFDAYELGMSVVNLGGGRRVASDLIDPSVGVSDILKSQMVAKGQRLATIHARSEGDAEAGKSRILSAIRSEAQKENLIEGVVE